MEIHSLHGDSEASTSLDTCGDGFGIISVDLPIAVPVTVGGKIDKLRTSVSVHIVISRVTLQLLTTSRTAWGEALISI